MFPDNNIAKQFQLGAIKAAYVISFGLAPYFHEKLLTTANSCNYFVLLFDEFMNKVSQHGQMDVHIRFWDNSMRKIVTRYLGFQFLGHASAKHLVSSFMEVSKNVNLRKMIQVFMDGPSVNWSFLDKLKAELEREPDDPVLLHLGICGLHIVHGAFQTGARASGFDIGSLLSSLYYMFNNSPARRDDYTMLTSSTVFPLKFCAHRWVENVAVADRALLIWKHVTKYIVGVKKKPDCRSFSVVKQHVDDSLTATTLHFLISVAAHLQTFLKMFQGNRPLLPILCDEVHSIPKSRIPRFMKPEVVAAADTILNYVKWIVMKPRIAKITKTFTSFLPLMQH